MCNFDVYVLNMAYGVSVGYGMSNIILDKRSKKDVQKEINFNTNFLHNNNTLFVI